jgi:hypothetical protein
MKSMKVLSRVINACLICASVRWCKEFESMTDMAFVGVWQYEEDESANGIVLVGAWWCEE